MKIKIKKKKKKKKKMMMRREMKKILMRITRHMIIHTLITINN